jgi:hypothetical protein
MNVRKKIVAKSIKKAKDAKNALTNNIYLIDIQAIFN